MRRKLANSKDKLENVIKMRNEPSSNVYVFKN